MIKAFYRIESFLVNQIALFWLRVIVFRLAREGAAMTSVVRADFRFRFSNTVPPAAIFLRVEGRCMCFQDSIGTGIVSGR